MIALPNAGNTQGQQQNVVITRGDSTIVLEP